MLIAKPLAVGDVVALKPLTGSDIIGRLAEPFKTGDAAVVLRKPVEAHVMQTGGGGLGLAFSPLSLCAPDDHIFRIPRAGLLVDPFPCRDEVKKTYNEQTTSLAI